MRSKTQYPSNLKLIICGLIFAFLFLFALRSKFSSQQNPSPISQSDSYDPSGTGVGVVQAATCPPSSTTPTCTKIPPTIVQAIIHYSTSSITPQQTLNEISVTSQVLESKSPCNFLVFGLGHDSLMWASLNHAGRTVFLEEDKSWIEQIRFKFPTLESYHVAYESKVHQADDLMKIGKGEDCMVVTDPRSSKCQLALKTIPTEIYEVEWDLIMVDAPTGYHENAPGRMSAIYTAGMMARNKQAGSLCLNIITMATASAKTSFVPRISPSNKSFNSARSSVLPLYNSQNSCSFSISTSARSSSVNVTNVLTREISVSEGLEATYTASKPTILVSEKLGEAGLKVLRSVANVDCSYNLSQEELCAKISLCDALIVRSGTKVTREVFEASKGRLKVVGRAGVGIDNVDLQAATEFGCLVVNAPTANTVAAAEHGIALLTSMARNVAQSDASMKAGKWERSKYVGVSLVGKTLAVMGFGKVGSEVARRAKGLGMHVVAHDPYAPADRARAVGVDLVSFDEAISTGDFISLHMPLTPTTSKILNDENFAKMKKGVRIINVARGGVIDEEALVRALDNGTVAQAALDVFTVEPPPKDSKLVQHANVTVTPHLGASTKEAQEGVAIEIAEAVVGALNGELAATAVNAPMVPAEVLSELAPYVVLAEKLGRLAVQLVSGGSGIKTVKVIYTSERDPSDLDTRLLRAMITKGIIEPISDTIVNLVNADFIAKQKGLRIIEERVMVDSSSGCPIDSIQVQIANVDSKFASALSDNGQINVEGKVKYGVPHLTSVGSFSVDVSLEGNIILCRQLDQPGMIGRVGSILGESNINVSFMSVGRTGLRKQAIMTIGVDEEPSKETLGKIGDVPAIKEFVFVDV